MIVGYAIARTDNNKRLSIYKLVGHTYQEAEAFKVAAMAEWPTSYADAVILELHTPEIEGGE